MTVHYRINWKPSGHRLGGLRGLQPGVGQQLRSIVPMRDHPDPRRLDVHASFRDPFEQLWVRNFYLNTAIKIFALVDMSASMRYIGEVSRMEVVRDILREFALSAYRNNDEFGVFSANLKALKNGTLPPRINRSAWLWVDKKFSHVEPEGDSAVGLLEISSQLPKKRGLVIVISDFRWPHGQANRLFKRLSHHDVVPIVLQDPTEVDSLPNNGIAQVRDMETGFARFVWMRNTLREKLILARQSHRHALEVACRTYGLQLFVVKGAFSADAMTRYFMERS